MCGEPVIIVHKPWWGEWRFDRIIPKLLCAKAEACAAANMYLDKDSKLRCSGASCSSCAQRHAESRLIFPHGHSGIICLPSGLSFADYTAEEALVHQED